MALKNVDAPDSGRLKLGRDDLQLFSPFADRRLTLRQKLSLAWGGTVVAERLSGLLDTVATRHVLRRRRYFIRNLFGDENEEDLFR